MTLALAAVRLDGRALDVADLTLKAGDRLRIATGAPDGDPVAHVTYSGDPTSLTFDPGAHTSLVLQIESRAYRRRGPARLAHTLNRPARRPA